MKKGGAAKGELVLAIYELANSYRHGWGVEKDPVAARSYYETAANLGDTDAMNEVARCYEEGFGGKKDRVSAISVPSVLLPRPGVIEHRFITRSRWSSFSRISPTTRGWGWESKSPDWGEGQLGQQYLIADINDPNAVHSGKVLPPC